MASPLLAHTISTSAIYHGGQKELTIIEGVIEPLDGTRRGLQVDPKSRERLIQRTTRYRTLYYIRAI